MFSCRDKKGFATNKNYTPPSMYLWCAPYMWHIHVAYCRTSLGWERMFRRCNQCHFITPALFFITQLRFVLRLGYACINVVKLAKLPPPPVVLPSDSVTWCCQLIIHSHSVLKAEYHATFQTCRRVHAWTLALRVPAVVWSQGQVDSSEYLIPRPLICWWRL